MTESEVRSLYARGLEDLSLGGKLGDRGFGLSFILPFAVTVARFGEFRDNLPWLSFDDLTAEEHKSVKMIAAVLAEEPDEERCFYTGQPDYHAYLYPIYSWNRRFTGKDKPMETAKIGMLNRPVRKERRPIERKHLRKEVTGFDRNYSPIVCAVAIARMVSKNGLDQHGEPIDPPDGYLREPDGD